MRRWGVVAVGIVLLVAAVRGQPGAPQRETITYLRQLQNADGGFRIGQSGSPETKGVSTLRATTSALRALRYCGGEPRDPKAAAAFVRSCFDKDSGGFADRPGGQPDVIVSAVGLMAVVELKMPREPYREATVRYLGQQAKTFEQIRMAAAGLESIGERSPQADAWIKQIEGMQNADGVFGKGDGTARATGGAVVALLRLGGAAGRKETVVKALKAGQRADGGFGQEGSPGSDLESTYRTVRAFVMLKEKPADVPACLAFVAKCRNADGGYAVAPGKPSTASGTYFASILRHWLAKE